MKYGDVLTVFLIVCFFASLGYSFGVNQTLWPIPAILFILSAIFVYKIWIEK